MSYRTYRAGVNITATAILASRSSLACVDSTQAPTPLPQGAGVLGCIKQVGARTTDPCLGSRQAAKPYFKRTLSPARLLFIDL
jgi:hypothetical protein